MAKLMELFLAFFLGGGGGGGQKWLSRISVFEGNVNVCKIFLFESF